MSVDMSDFERDCRDFVEVMDELRKEFPDNFQGDWIVLSSRCAMGPDTIAESNERWLQDNFPVQVFVEYRPYVYEAMVSLNDIQDADTAREALEVLQAMREYPILCDSTYSELEHERLSEYVREELPVELCSELGLNVWTLDEWIAEWCVKFGGSRDFLDYWTGSVDDCPLDVEAIARDFRDELVMVAAVAYLSEWFEYGDI